MLKILPSIALFSFITIGINAQEVVETERAPKSKPVRSEAIPGMLQIKVTGNNFNGTTNGRDNYRFNVDQVSVSDDKNTLDFQTPNFQTVTRFDRSAYQQSVLNSARSFVPVYTHGADDLKDKYKKKEMYITMRDGVKLFTSIYTPIGRSEPSPILIHRTPYNSEPVEEEYSSRLSTMQHLLDEGYIIVFQDVRGKYMSEGEYVDVRPFIPNKKKNEIDENSDTYDTIEWLVNNVENNNGNVGVFGISYPGFYSTMALPNAHPALKAVSPQAPVTNWFLGDDWHHNGAFFLIDPFSFYPSFGRPRPAPTRVGNPRFQYNSDDNYTFFLELGPIKNAATRYFGDTLQFWSDLMAHPNYDQFWKERDPLPHLTDVKPAVMTVGGWFDAEDLFGPLNVYSAIETQNPENQNRLVMGPWSHGQWARGTGASLGNIHFGSNTAEHYREFELKFFNYYLKGQGSMDLPEASIFVTGINEWKSFDEWPPSSAQAKSLYLQSDGKLSFTEPNIEDSYDEYVADPSKPVPYTEDVHLGRTREYLTDDQRFASRRPDVMVYQTGELKEDVTIAGSLQVNFFVSTTGTDADYVVKLIDVFPDQMPDYPKNEKGVPMGGYQMLVRGDVLRGKYRNSFEKPEPFIAGQVTEVNFKIQDTAHTFKKGHKIMIQVQNSWFPLVDRNPQQFVNIYEADEKDFIKATHRIYHDSQRPSHVQVQVLSE